MGRIFGSIFNADKGEQRAGPASYANSARVAVDDSRAMQVAAVFRCIRIIAETAGTLPLIVYERGANGTRQVVREHWLTALLNAPNSEMTGDELREALVASIAGWGNGYAQVVRAAGKPKEIWPYKVDRMKVSRRADLTLQYQYPSAEGVLVDLPRAELLHFRGFSLDGVMGLSPLALARESLGLTVGAENYAASFYASGGRPAGVLSVDKVLRPEQREQIRGQFTGLTDDNEKRFWVLEAGLKYQPVTVPPEDMQMLQTRAFQLADIARFFGVPLFLLMQADNVPNWGLEQQNLAFLTYTLRPYLTRLEASFNRWLVPEKERGKIYVEHNTDSLLRADSAARASLYSTMVQNGLMTRNEVRERENLAPMDGGDILTAQTNLAALSDITDEPDDEPAPAPIVIPGSEPAAPSAPPGAADEDASDDDSVTRELAFIRAGLERLEYQNRRPVIVNTAPSGTLKRVPERDANGRIVAIRDVYED
jgi:HK97 family phage portal protein